MNATIKAKWVEALRSGKYKQGIGRLYRPESNEYCCLGVLCRVADVDLESDSSLNYGLVFQPLGLRKYWDLVEMNDNGSSFARIADYIETTVL